MIHIERKNGSIKIKAAGDAEALLKELGHATGAILNTLIRGDMTDKSKSLIERAETVIRMIECCTERELCAGCPYEQEPECHPLTTAKELISELVSALPEWRDVVDELPADCDKLVLCRVNGRHGSVEFHDARCLGTYHDGEGWALEAWPDWENPDVTHWMDVP